MKIQLDDGTELEIAPGLCPRCALGSPPITSRLGLHHTSVADPADIDMAKHYDCPACGHHQVVIVDNPDYDSSLDIKAEE